MTYLMNVRNEEDFPVKKIILALKIQREANQNKCRTALIEYEA